jgi:type IV pilus assembly protein PilQ
MKKDQMKKIVWLLAMTAGVSCGEKKPPSSPATSENAPAPVELTPDPSGLNVLSIIDVQKQASGGSKVVLTGTKPMSPNIFKLTEPDRVVVDLTDTKVGNVGPDTNVDDASIQNIKVEQFDDAQSSLSRVEIVLKAPAEYQVESNGNTLSLNIGQMDSSLDSSANPVDAAVVDGSLADEQVFSVNKDVSQDPFSLSNQQDGISTKDLEQTLSNPVGASDVAVVDAGLQSATSLTDVNYAASSEGTVVILTGNGNFESIENTSLENPNRIVVDLKNIKKDYKGSSKISLNTSEVGNIRIGESNGNVRVVLDLSGKSIPEYRVDNVDGKITINIPTVAMTQVPTESVQQTFVEAPVVDMVETPVVEATVEETTSAEAAVAVDMTLPPTNSKKIIIDKVNFEHLADQGKSRLTIGVNQSDAKFDVQEISDQELKVLIPNSKFKSSVLSKFLDTSGYESVVKKITPKYSSSDKSIEFAISLSEKVNYNIQQDANAINVDFEIPTAMAQNSEVTEEKPSTVSETIVVPETTMSAKGEVKGTLVQKDYRYVKESFMSDSATDDSPLSQMGAILAGNVSGKKFSGRKISLDFKDADIRSIFRLIADISKFNLIISDDVAGRVTIKLDEVPWDQAFAIILQSKGLWFEKYGQIVRIAPAKRLQEEKEAAAAAEQAAQAVKPLDILFKPVSFAQADTLIKQVGAVLSTRGSVDIDSRTNTLIIKDIRENLEKAKKMVDILDTQTPQVSIESRIVEATTTFTRSFGITWGGNTRFTAATGNPTGLYFPNSVAVSPWAMNFPVEGGFVNSTANVKLGSINNVVDLDVSLALGETKGYAKLISAPKVTVLDNKSATITSGSRIPFITQTADSGSNVRFENAATTLNVTPHITNDGSILMTITATRNEPNFAQLVQGNPLIDQRTATTEVLVKSGNTTVLGGIYATRSGRSINRFPFLSSIPIIGALFQNYNKTSGRTELLIFVTPRIVGDEREAIRDIRE